MCIVLLRAVNVGGRNRLPMTALADVLVDAGCGEVRTYLQSGNAVVRAEPAGLAERVEAGLADRVGLSVRVLVRTGEELAEVIRDSAVTVAQLRAVASTRNRRSAATSGESCMSPP